MILRHTQQTLSEANLDYVNARKLFFHQKAIKILLEWPKATYFCQFGTGYLFFSGEKSSILGDTANLTQYCRDIRK